MGEATGELNFNRAEQAGTCTVCGGCKTQLKCMTCTPNHYVCGCCIDRHRQDVFRIRISRMDNGQSRIPNEQKKPEHRPRPNTSRLPGMKQAG